MATAKKTPPNLENYVEVHERITKFYEKHPEGSLQSSWSMKEIGGKESIVVEARAYRSPEDKRPGVGLASEPVPGATPYTKDSELMNAETSAWGRALAALGFEVHRGIASGNEVRSRGGGGDDGSPPTAKQKNFVLGTKGRPGLFDKASLGEGQRKAILRWVCGESMELTKVGASRVISALKEDAEKGAQSILIEIQNAGADGDEDAKAAMAYLDSDVPFD